MLYQSDTIPANEMRCKWWLISGQTTLQSETTTMPKCRLKITQWSCVVSRTEGKSKLHRYKCLKSRIKYCNLHSRKFKNNTSKMFHKPRHFYMRNQYWLLRDTLNYYVWTNCNIQHFNYQLTYTTLKKVELLKHFKISKTATTCFGLQVNHHQGATVST